MAALLLPFLLQNSNSITRSKIKIYLLQFRILDTVNLISVEREYYSYKTNVLQTYCKKP